MKREILLNHEATAIAAKHGCAGLYEMARHLYLEKTVRREDVASREYNPATTVGFFFNQAAGEAGIITATAGSPTPMNDGLEGVRFLFQAEEVAEARKALLAELDDYDQVMAVLKSAAA